MSYLPSSRLYEREPEAKPVEAVATEPPAAAPKPAKPTLRRATMLPKEWLVAPTAALQVEPATLAPDPVVVIAAPEETVTTPATTAASNDEGPARKRNLFHQAQKVVLRHLDRAKKKIPQEPEPDLLWFAVMALGSVCMGLMVWGAYSALPRVGNGPLRKEASIHRLKASSDVPGHWPREAIQTQYQTHVPQTPPLAVPAPPVSQGPAHPAPPPAPPVAVPGIPVAALPAPHEPTFVERRVPEPARPALPEPPLEPLPERPKDPPVLHANLGDSPMIRTWHELAKASFLLTAFSAASANHLLAEGQGADTAKQIEELNKTVKALSDHVKDLKFEQKLADLKTELNQNIAKIKTDAPKLDNKAFDEIHTRLDDLERLINRIAKAAPGAIPAAPAAAQANANLDGLYNKLDSIEKAILRLQPTEKISLSPPLSPPLEPAIAKPATSHVILVNFYDEDLWLWVNQKPHRVPAGKSTTVNNVPAGPTTIEVRSPEAIFYKVNPVLAPNETITLTAKK
jgi:hypothetical protein